MRSVTFLLALFLALWLGVVSGQQNSTNGTDAFNKDINLDAWTSFVTKFGRKYGDASELKKRKAIFDSNLKLINFHNGQARKGLHSYTLASNKFADLTPEEFAQRYLTFKMQKKFANPTNFTNTTQTGQIMERNMAQAYSASLPASYDMRRTVPYLMNPIQDQEDCGSCWAFATTANLETQYAKRYGQLLKFSEQYLVDCDFFDYGCNGGDPANAFFYAWATGVPLASTKPYVAQQNSYWTCRNLRKVARSDLFSYEDSLSNLSDIMLKQLTVQKGMIVVPVDASKLQFYSSGIMDGSSCSEVNHVVNLIGYVSSTASSTGHWILKNQWGTNWGENGYFRVAMNSKPCLVNKYAWFAQYD